MKKYVIVLVLALVCNIISAQTARNILDKTAATISYSGGITANFNMSSEQYGDTKGTISVKGRKFYASTQLVSIWFDGKSLWTYMKRNNEVNVTNPTDAQLSTINPYNFINIYKNGFKYDMKTVGKEFQIHLTATDKNRKTQEMYIHINKTTYIPSLIKMRQGAKWNTISINNFKKANLNDNLFRFNRNAYKDVEMIDLR